MRQIFYPVSANISPPCYCSLVGYSVWRDQYPSQQIWPFAGTLSKLNVRVVTTPPVGTGYVLTLQVNGVDTALTCTILAGQVTAFDATHAVTIAAGDLVNLAATAIGSPEVSTCSFTVEWTPNTPGQSVYGLSAYNLDDETVYNGLFTGYRWTNNAAVHRTIAAMDGTIRSLHIRAQGVLLPMSGYIFAIYKNGVRQDGTGGTVDTLVAVDGAGTLGESFFTLPMVAGDIFYVEAVPYGDLFIFNAFAAVTVGVESAISWQSQSSGWVENALEAEPLSVQPAMSSHVWLDDGDPNANAIGALSRNAFRDLRVLLLDGAPGEGSSYAFSFRRDETSPAHTPRVTVADDAETGVDPIGVLSVNQTQFWNFQAAPVNGPASRHVTWSFVQGTQPIIGPLAWVHHRRRLPNGTIVENLYSDQDMHCPTQWYGGEKTPRVMAFGDAECALSHRWTGEWSGSTCRIQYADSDQMFRRQLASVDHRYWVPPFDVYMTTRDNRAELGDAYMVFAGPIVTTRPVPPSAIEITLGDAISQGLLSDRFQIPWRQVRDGFLTQLVEIAPSLDLDTPEGTIYGNHRRIPDIDPPVPEGFAYTPTYLGKGRLWDAETPPETPPPDEDSVILYADNAGLPDEWPWSDSGVGMDVASTSDPRTGTTSIEGTDVAHLSYVEGFIVSSSVDPELYAALIFYIKSKGAWPIGQELRLNFRRSNHPRGSYVTLADGAFGFSSANTATYQRIEIPVSAFGVHEPINQLRITKYGGVDIGFFIDDIFLGDSTAEAPVGSLTGALYHTWLVCGHACYDIPWIRVDGEITEEGSDWLIPHHDQWMAVFGVPYVDKRSSTYGNMRRYTLIYGLVGAAGPDACASGEKTLTVGVSGVEDRGDATGNLLLDRFQQRKHFEINYVANRGQSSYQSGLWLSNPTWSLFGVSVPIVDEASYDQATAIGLLRIGGGYVGAAIIGAKAGDRASVLSWIAKWNRSCACQFGITNLGQIRIVPLHPTEAIKAAAPLITDAYVILRDSFETDIRSSDHANRTPFRGDYEHASGQWKTNDVDTDADTVRNYDREIPSELREYDFAPGITMLNHLAVLETRVRRFPPRAIGADSTIGPDAQGDSLGYLNTGDYIRYRHYAAVGSQAQIRLAQIEKRIIKIGQRRVSIIAMDCEDLIGYDTVELSDAAENTACATALALEPTGMVTVDTSAAQTDASVEGLLPSPSGFAYHAAWFTITPPADGTLRLDTAGSTYDTQMALLTGTCGSDDWALVTYNDNDDLLNTSAFELAVVGGMTYYVLVAGVNPDDGGTLILRSAFEEDEPT